MKIMPVQKQTRAGQRTRFKAFVVVGDHNGHVGLGVKCAKEVGCGVVACYPLHRTCLPHCRLSLELSWQLLQHTRGAVAVLKTVSSQCPLLGFDREIEWNLSRKAVAAHLNADRKPVLPCRWQQPSGGPSSRLKCPQCLSGEGTGVTKLVSSGP